MFIYFVAVGPGKTGRDAIESVLRYKEPESRLIVLNDTKKEFLLDQAWGDIEVFTPNAIPAKYSQTKSTYGLLYLKKTMLLDFAVEKYRKASGYIYLDDDALLIREGLENLVRDLFISNPNVGIAGAYKISASDGSPRDFRPPAKSFRNQINPLNLVRRGKGWFTLRKVISRAKSNGYEMGEHALGGALLFSSAFISSLVADSDLTSLAWADSNIPEDSCFALACKALGFELLDFSAPADPLAIKWRGLTAEPEELIKSGKYLIHSTDYSDLMTGEEVLAFFRKERNR